MMDYEEAKLALGMNVSFLSQSEFDYLCWYTRRKAFTAYESDYEEYEDLLLPDVIREYLTRKQINAV